MKPGHPLPGARRRDIRRAESMKLNIGCGHARRDGYVNIDRSPRYEPDLLWDLERTPYPFDDNAVEEIAAHHVLTHLGRRPAEFLAIVKELHRILLPGGIIDILTAHPRCDDYWSDPTNVRPVTPHGMARFGRAYASIFAQAGGPATPLAEELGVDFEILSVENHLFADWAHRFSAGELSAEQVDRAAQMNWNVVQHISMVMRKV
jgi:SAM-dependent methyltransferase